MPTLYIIDGYAQFFRAYHAIRTPMTSPVAAAMPALRALAGPRLGWQITRTSAARAMAASGNSKHSSSAASTK